MIAIDLSKQQALDADPDHRSLVFSLSYSVPPPTDQYSFCFLYVTLTPLMLQLLLLKIFEEKLTSVCSQTCENYGV